MPALALSMLSLLLCGFEESSLKSVSGEDECVLNGQTCTIRVVSPWSTSPIEAREEVRRRYRSHLIKLVTHHDVNALSPNEVDRIERQARTLMNLFDESHEERPRVYGTVYRTTLSAVCSSQALHHLEEGWLDRRRRKSWALTTLILITPLFSAGLVAGFVQLDRRSHGDQRGMLTSCSVLILIIGGVTLQRIWQLL